MDEIAASGIVIGPDGRRIVDEGEGGIAIANRLARLGDPGSASIIFDSAIWEGPGRSARIPANPQLERGGGTLFRADTLDGLARALNVPADALRESVTQYNRAIAAGEGGLMQPPRRTDVHRAWPIEKPPFMASRICVGITYTMGGISIDDHARVLRPDRSPIPGLFAAGTTTGGIEGSGRTGYVGGLTKSGVLGLRAGESAVKLVQSSDGAAVHA
jgi:fumarate reductase flavoprotein subunit